MTAAIEGNAGSAILSERNAVAVEKLRQVLANRQKRRVALFYGGAHMPGIEAALLAVDSQIAARMHRSEDLAAELVTATSTIVASETTPERRAELMLRVAAIGQEQGRIATEIEALKVERSQREADLNDYRRQLSFASL